MTPVPSSNADIISGGPRRRGGGVCKHVVYTRVSWSNPHSGFVVGQCWKVCVVQYVLFSLLYQQHCIIHRCLNIGDCYRKQDKNVWVDDIFTHCLKFVFVFLPVTVYNVETFMKNAELFLL